MSRTKRRIANLDPAESYKPQLVTTQWLDNDGVVRTTTHDGNFSPPPKEPTLVFVPAQFCDELSIMQNKEENPQQIENGSYKYVRSAFVSKVPQSESQTLVVVTLDNVSRESRIQGSIIINDSTLADFSEDFQDFLEPYKGTGQICFADTKIDDWLDSGIHTIKVEYNGEESETKAFVVGGNALLPNAVQDYDGNWYDAVIIGDQVWTASNLRTTHYADGTSIPNIGSSSYDQTNGLFYRVNAMLNSSSASSDSNPSGIQGISPSSWHIPSVSEWDEMKNYLRTNLPSGTQIGPSLTSETYGGTNLIGFNATADGAFNFTDSSMFQYGSAYYWTTNMENSVQSYIIRILPSGNDIESFYINTILQTHVRCVCDLTTEDFLAWYYNKYGSYNHQIQ